MKPLIAKIAATAQRAARAADIVSVLFKSDLISRPLALQHLIAKIDQPWTASTAIDFTEHSQNNHCSKTQSEKAVEMATNTGKDFRRGAVTGRTQFQRPDGDWQKRDERTGHFMSVKQSEGPYKGVAKEPDGRDTKSS